MSNMIGWEEQNLLWEHQLKIEIDSTCTTASLFGFYILAVILGILLFHYIIGYIIVLHEYVTLG